MIPCEILDGIDKLAQQNNLASLNCINEVEVLRVRMKCATFLSFRVDWLLHRQLSPSLNIITMTDARLPSISSSLSASYWIFCPNKLHNNIFICVLCTVEFVFHFTTECQHLTPRRTQSADDWFIRPSQHLNNLNYLRSKYTVPLSSTNGITPEQWIYQAKYPLIAVLYLGFYV